MAPEISEEKSDGGGIGGAMAWMGGVNLVAFAAGIVRQKLFAVFLGPVGLGALSLALAFFELLATGSRLGAPSGLLREFSRALGRGETDRAARILRDTRRLVMVLAGGVAVVAIAFADPIARVLFNGALPAWAVRVVALAVPLSLNTEIFESVLNGFDRIRLLASQKLGTILLSLAVTAVLVVGWGLEGGVLQIAGGALVAFVVSGVVARRLFRVREHGPELVPDHEAREMLGEVFRVGLAVAVYHLAVSANLFVFRSYLVETVGLRENGIYQATLGLSRQYTNVMAAAIFVYLFPRLSQCSDDPEAFRRELSRVARFLVTVAVPAALLILGFRDWLVLLVFSREFLPMVPLMTLSVPADVLAVLAALLRTSLLALGRTRRFMVAGVGAELAYFGLFVWGTRTLGLQGSVASYLVTSTLMILFFGAFLGRRNLPRIGWRALGIGVTALASVALTLSLPVGPLWSRGLALVLAGAWLLIRRRDLARGFSEAADQAE